MRSFLRDNGLTLFFLLLLVLALVGQAVSGMLVFNDRQLTSGGTQVSMAHYLTSSQFAVDVAENWQSEFLQFFLYIFMTVWLVQRGYSAIATAVAAIDGNQPIRPTAAPSPGHE